MGNWRRWMCAAVAAGAAMAWLGGPAAAQQDFGLDNVILDTSSLWRYRMVWETEEVQLESGEVGHFAWTADPRTRKTSFQKAAKVLVLPADTQPDWTRADFDDRQWARFRGPFVNFDIGVKNLMLRGRFDVPDTDRAGDLELTASFFGGLVAWLLAPPSSEIFADRRDFASPRLRVPASRRRPRV